MTRIILDDTTTKLQVKLGEAKTTNEVKVSANFYDSTTSGSAISELSQEGTSTGTTAADIVDVPAAATKRVVVDGQVYNNDTVSHIVILQKNVNTVITEIGRGTLAASTACNFDDLISSSVNGATTLYRRYIVCTLNSTTALTTADKFYFRIPSDLNGMNLVSVTGSNGTGAAGSSSSGNPTFTVKNVTDNNQMLSTSLTIDSGEYTSATAATPVVIDTTKDDVVTDDLIEVAVTTSGTGTTYAVVTTGWALP